MMMMMMMLYCYAFFLGNAQNKHTVGGEDLVHQSVRPNFSSRKQPTNFGETGEHTHTKKKTVPQFHRHLTVHLHA